MTKTRSMVFLFSTAAAIIAIQAACTPRDLNSRIDAHDDEIQKMTVRIAELEKDRLDHNLRIADLETGYKTGWFKPGDKGFVRIDSEIGSFFVSMTDIVPYANGYKASFNIGNPNQALYTNPILRVKWGPAFGNSEAVKAGAKERSNQITILSNLKPGTWNRVSVIMAPAEKNEIESIQVSLETPTVSMAK